MTFTSGVFFSFLIVLLVVYFLVPKRYQWIVLLAGSYFFYIYSSKSAIFFLIITTISVFFFGGWIGKEERLCEQRIDSAIPELDKERKKVIRSKSKRRRKYLLATGLLLNFGILFSLKYFDFFASSTDAFFNIFSIDANVPRINNLLLPLGISFYTFQSTGYLIDVFRGKVKPDDNIFKFALFVSFFPQIVQGPIGRYDELASQLVKPHSFDYTRIKFGFQLILWGLFKKMVIADRTAILVNSIFDHYTDYSGFMVFAGAFLYTIQIYTDFSGGIDVARGVAQILGITLRENFKRPFFATSIEDYWRRWHISLSEWMRDYIFYPLALSKIFTKIGKSARKIFGPHIGKFIPIFIAQMITFLAVGLWHGANWKYVVFGLYNGFFIIIGILFEPILKSVYAKYKINTTNFSWRFINIVLTFFLVCISRFFSRAPDLITGLRMIKRSFADFNPWVLTMDSFTQLGLNERNIYLLILAVFVLLVVDIFQESGIHLREKIAEQNLVFRWALYLIAIFSILIFGVYGLGYNPSDFIYRGF